MEPEDFQRFKEAVGDTPDLEDRVKGLMNVEIQWED